MTRDLDDESTPIRTRFDARTVKALSAHKRERILAKAAALVENDCRGCEALGGFESLSEGDHRDEAASN